MDTTGCRGCVAGLATAVLFSAAAWGGGPAQGERLGEVDFPVTCSPPAQQTFNAAMARFHAFAFDAAKAAFTQALEQDPACGMAHWGVALTSMGSPYTWGTNADALQAGAAAAAEAARVGAYSQRERDYIAALGVLFRDSQTTAFRTRAVAFERAMDALSARYAKDDEAQILYALAINVAAQSAGTGEANPLKAAAILEPLYQRRARHPGLARYLIHTYDAAELGAPGVPLAASAGSDAAPRMPTHVYARLGMWNEMVEDNRASYQRGQTAPRAKALGIGTGEALHAMDYMLYGHLQQAQDEAAKALADEAAAISKLDAETFAAAHALAAIPARYHLERGDWQHAAMLRPSPSNLAWEKFPQAESVVVFARGLGAARSGFLDIAQMAVARLNVLHAAMVDAGMPYWPEQTASQIHAVNAWIALAERRNEAARYLMREAADIEAAADKHPASPGSVVPARELLGEMLFALNEPEAALVEFERSLERDPNRFRGLYGAAQAAHVAGNAALARTYFARLQALTAERDSQRPELDDAEAFLTGRSVFVSEAIEAGAIEAESKPGLAHGSDGYDGTRSAYRAP